MLLNKISEINNRIFYLSAEFHQIKERYDIEVKELPDNRTYEYEQSLILYSKTRVKEISDLVSTLEEVTKLVDASEYRTDDKTELINIIDEIRSGIKCSKKLLSEIEDFDIKILHSWIEQNLGLINKKTCNEQERD